MHLLPLQVLVSVCIPIPPHPGVHSPIVHADHSKVFIPLLDETWVVCHQRFAVKQDKIPGLLMINVFAVNVVETPSYQNYCG